MGVFDIVLGVPLLYAVYRGFRDGIAVPAGGILALLLGVFLAYRYGRAAGELLGIGDEFAKIAGFIIIFLAVLVVIALLSRAIRGIFRFAGLRLIDQVGGVVLALLKMGIVLGILLIAFEAVNARKQWTDPSKIEESFLYKPVKDAAEVVFPYLVLVKDKLYE